MGKPNTKPVINRKRIIKVIKQDANGKNFLLNVGKYCVLGGLLSAAGVPNELLKGNKAPSDVSYKGLTGKKILTQRYGLSSSDQDSLMDINDNYDNTKERRAALVDFVNDLA